MRGSSRRVEGGADRLHRGARYRRRPSRLAEELFAVVAVVDGNAPCAAPWRPVPRGRRQAGTGRALWAARSARPPSASSRRSSASAGPPSATCPTPSRAYAVQAVASAEREGRIDRVEDELFRFERIVAAGPRAARHAVRAQPRRGRQGHRSSTAPRGQGRARDGAPRRAGRPSPAGRRFDQVLGEYLALAATRREQLTALVTVGRAPHCTAAALAAGAPRGALPRPCPLNAVVDPPGPGRHPVEIGDEVVDGTVLRRSRRLARRRLSSRAPGTPTRTADAPPTKRPRPTGGRNRGEDLDMTELSIRPEEIRDALDTFVRSYEPGAASAKRSAASPTPVTASPTSRVCPRP